jgi:hypothetical protein
MKIKMLISYDEQEVLQKEPERLLNGNNCRSALFEFDQWLRTKIKHEDKDWQEIRDQFWVIVKAYDVIMD